MGRSSDSVFPLSLIKDKTFKMRQIRKVMFWALFFIVQSTIVLGFFYHNLLGELVQGTAPLLFASEDLQSINESVPSVTAVMGKWLLIMLGINALVSVFVGVYVMRKLGNPLLAMKRALNEIGDGNLNVRLRAGDDKEFAELSAALNRAVETVQAKVEAVRRETEVLDNLGQQRAADAEVVQDALVNCRNVLSFFDHKKNNESRPPANNA